MLELIKKCVHTSGISLLSNKTRSFLTMLGIIIGVGSVIVIMAVGYGAQSLILAQVQFLGTNLIGIMPGKSDSSGPPTSVMGIVITTLTYDDVQALRNKDNVPDLVEAVGFTNGIGTAVWGSSQYGTNLTGVTAGYLEVEGGELTEGRFFTENEERNMVKLAVLGSSVKNELFGESDALGQRIKIKNNYFEVIGVMKERGKVAFQDYDDQIILPLRPMQRLVVGVNHLGLVRAKINKEENIARAIEDISVTLRIQHGIGDMSGQSDDFTVRSAAEALDMITSITDALRYFLAAMAALSLLVGGIGIMNIMLVRVTERTREIGLRKAVGANNANIRLQFLIESSAMTTIGGIIGILAGISVSFIIYLAANYLGYEWAFIISPQSVVLAVMVSTLVGLIFGLYPAKKASKLDPVEALRYE